MSHGFRPRVAAADPDKETEEDVLVEREREKEQQENEKDSSENGSREIVYEDPHAPPRVDDYIIRDGTRLVRPYYFEFVAHVKRRWIGKLLVDIYEHEFKGRDREYYLLAIENGRILVDGRRVPPSFRVVDSQKLSHFVHRHEPPVRAEPALRVLYQGPDVIAVCKPPTVPVHACGQYRKNTVVGILEAELRTGPLFPIHRLDRLVSGLLILARNKRTANDFRGEIEGGRVHKQYVAKVRGVFPAHSIEVNVPLAYDPRDGVSRVVEADGMSSHSTSSTIEMEKGKLTEGKSEISALQVFEVNSSVVEHTGREGVSAPGEVDVAETGLNMEMNGNCVNEGKEERKKEEKEEKFGAKVACTKFQRLSSDGVCSIVRCEPVTGRTHQIRVHLRHLGHPIANDVLYSQPELRKRSTEGVWGANTAASEAELLHEAELRPQTTGMGTSPENGTGTERVPFLVDPLCTHCPKLEPAWYRPDEEGLWLHCVRYASPAWAYECPLPDWAL